MALTKISKAMMGDNSIDSDSYVDGSIDTAHVGDDQITLAKMAGGTDGQIITFDASGDPVAVGPGSDGQVLTSTGAGSPPAFETPSVAARKSLIINGAMNIAQRGTSFAAMANGYSLDRWKFEHSSIGAYTVTQDSSGPAGFANSLKIDCTTADASPAAGDFLQLKYRMEGQDLQHLKKGTASAESITLSFWVKCNKTGNFASRIYDDDNNRIIGNTVTISSADTWEYKSITYAGDTTGALGDDANTSLMIDWTFDAGSTYTSGAVPTSWETYTNADYAAGTTLALADSTSNYINITGVKLEVGTSATDFEHKHYNEELILCQRYCRKLGSGVLGLASGTTTFYFSAPFELPMRATPTLTLFDTSVGVGNMITYDKTSSSSAFTLARSSKTGAVGVINGFTSMTAGDPLQVWQSLTDDYWLLCDAEL